MSSFAFASLPTTVAAAQEIARLKSEARFFHAGALAFIADHGPRYGCHFGMTSTRRAAMANFEAGYTTARADARMQGAVDWSLA